MDLGLKGKTGIVTGASQGIGKAIALALAGEGVHLVLGSRRYEELAKTASEIAVAGGSQAIPIAVDLTRLDEIRSFVRQAAEKLGRIDILVNCVSASIMGTFLELSDEAWKTILETKYFGYIRCLREVLPYMMKQKDGRIVNISGIAGILPNPVHLPGGSANAAINLITKGLAAEMGKYNIRVNAVVPGPVATEKLVHLMQALAVEKNIRDDSFSKGYTAQVPLGRIADPAEIADLVVYLVSDRSSYITGECLTIDGGRLSYYSAGQNTAPKPPPGTTET